ncbi:hypothetical protein B0H10DRAFT_2042917 [Mycena sp. CBHHK59/15]|nr:hypothetical protein B0H10DRAFT_2042917 [Mycena sp. CBHHK59/15]
MGSDPGQKCRIQASRARRGYPGTPRSRRARPQICGPCPASPVLGARLRRKRVVV